MGDWTYYDNFSSSPAASFTYDGAGERIQYGVTTATETSFMRIPLDQSLGGYTTDYDHSFSVSFKITPESGNSSSFVPLLLCEDSLTQPDNHPWRTNAPGSTAGNLQDVDILGVSISVNEIILLSRDDDNGATATSFDTPFNMTADEDYWVLLESVDMTTVSLSVFDDADMLSVLAYKEVTIPALEEFNFLYIANSNGNTASDQHGYLDDYEVNREEIPVFDWCQIYHFEDASYTDDWDYYDNFSSIPEASFTYDAINERIRYDVTTGTETSFMRVALNDSIGGFYGVFDHYYSASFKITPDNGNTSSFIPLLLSADSLTQPNNHPWRTDNAGGGAGALQDLDILGINISGSEVRLISRDDDNSATTVSFTSPFMMTAEEDYWIRIESSGATEVIMSVYSDEDMLDELASQEITIPSLKSFKFLYLANSNGNTASDQHGYLDDYIVKKGDVDNVVLHTFTNDLENPFVSPNPVSERLFLSDELNFNNLNIYNSQGMKESASVNQESKTIDVSEMSAGLYILTDGVHSIKFYKN